MDRADGGCRDRAGRGCCLLVCLYLGACTVLLYRDVTSHQRAAAEGRAAIRPGMGLTEALAAARTIGKARVELEPYDGTTREVDLRDARAVAALELEVAATTTATGWTVRVPFHQMHTDSSEVAWAVFHVDRAGKVTSVDATGGPPPRPDEPTAWASRHASQLGGMLRIGGRQDAWAAALAARLGADGGRIASDRVWPKGPFVEVTLGLALAVDGSTQRVEATWLARPSGELAVVKATWSGRPATEAEQAKLLGALRDIVWADVLEALRSLDALQPR